MADLNTTSDVRIVKVLGTISANTNIEGLLVPYRGIGTGPGTPPTDEPSWLDMEGGHAQVYITIDGVPKLTGPDNTYDFYPGEDIQNGDLKANFDLTAGMLILIRYKQLLYREIGTP